jgi:hypothetical protein
MGKENNDKIEFSKKYIPDGKISEILRFKLDQALSHYELAVRQLNRIYYHASKSSEFSLEDALVKDAFIVGGLLFGRNDSGIDLYLQTNNTSYNIDNQLRFCKVN